MKALILFSSRDGQTREIAFYIANQIKGERECDVFNIQLLMRLTGRSMTAC